LSTGYVNMLNLFLFLLFVLLIPVLVSQAIPDLQRVPRQGKYCNFTDYFYNNVTSNIVYFCSSLILTFQN